MNYIDALTFKVLRYDFAVYRSLGMMNENEFETHEFYWYIDAPDCEYVSFGSFSHDLPYPALFFPLLCVAVASQTMAVI